ncbi:MAG: inorganic phosphate transporter [Paludibacter sp.]|nr:inorganic phosphate transporter [Bacteroidales bacterium]MCM1068610.1 inorganic phosphate transporter [Prevotella sp.]MCM1353274.1 inorganic phosphate transporter [Bacteroides sp.]MCM1442318.1 inorganic phosphate transporter [Muribaculum sp.]MCM1481137.1 inorganic phosphate transporter [Paludibacter sp.]
MGFLIAIIVLCICFDFINGFHDSANSIATVVSTKVLRPFTAVVWAAVFNFIAFFIAKYIIGGFGVAETVQKTVVESSVSLPLLAAGLIAAIIWSLFTWWKGIPSSSSHTLIGGLVGAALAAQGWNAVHWGTVGFIALFIFVAPLIGFVAGNIISVLTYWVARRVKPHKADKWFKRLQLVSSAGLSIGHGLNDAQKEMGVIACALVAYTQTKGISLTELPAWLQLSDNLPFPEWIPFACFTAIAIGTMTGGMRVIKTMGNKITKLTPVEGFCSQTAGALTLTITGALKVPVSTTHVISGSIMGTGAVKRLSAVRWGVTLELVTAWIITIPISAAIGAAVYGIFSLFL